ncbi:GH25 family lysozyme [Micromonospora sagamiensis]|uniref:Lysozyme n=3 Tax=Micromonospora sagamiensis TaxID=47875 RepID=A0A562WLY3_9ACTN|nr:GH25 family lysozyme [Micromonospora sagamiensis]TWJ31310.1 GH25 family lysozyme M1 (1,4-beta-N-acetylmuramidase) [Micromonospora sagamiensis]
MSRTRLTLRRLVATSLAALATAAVGLIATTTPASAATVAGVDVSHWQGSINWTSVRNSGIEFAYIKATEGTSYKDPQFNANYTNSYYAGVIRGAYHFARPNISSGAVQANYLASNGGAWSADSRTLPAALDVEGNPYSGGYCYGLSTTGMRNWIQDFLNTYRSRTGRYAVIYTTTSWWNQCTGSWTGPWGNHPLWIARWSSSPGTLPAGAPFWSFWQYTDSGTVSGISGGVDRNYWNGDRSRLIALANNT